jgi:hypothetical protein
MSIETPFLGTSRNPFNYEKVEQVARDITSQWLTDDEITQQLNMFGDISQDGYLESLDLATRMAIEDYLGMSIFSTTYQVYYGAFSSFSTSQVFLDLPEVTQGIAGVTINSVKYYNSDTPPVLTTLANSNYFYDPSGNRAVVFGIPQPVNVAIANPIVINFTCNASPLAQYPVIKQAGLMLLTHIYNQRSDTTTENLRNIPFGVSTLLRPYKPLVM